MSYFPKIDIVIPVFNAENHIKSTLDELWLLNDLLSKVILINDASTDSSLSLLSVDWEKVEIHSNPTNYGQHESTRIGILFSKADYVLTIDDDLPLDTNNMRYFVERAIKNGKVLSYADYQRHTSGIRQIGSMITNRIMLRNLGLKGNGSSTRLIQRSLIEKLRGVDQKSKFLDADLLDLTRKVGLIQIESNEIRNVSRYSMAKLIKLFSHMLIRS